MIDTIDQAQEHEQQLRADALAQRIAPPAPGQGSTMCKRCHGYVESKRADLGYATCIECQERIERGVR
jgi:hypothetical protein